MRNQAPADDSPDPGVGSIRASRGPVAKPSPGQNDRGVASSCWTRGAREAHGTAAGSQVTERAGRPRSPWDLDKFGFGSLSFAGQGKSYEKGAVALRQGEPSEQFGIVMWGWFKSCRQSQEGRSLIVGLYGPGNVVGFAGALSGRPRRTSIEAVDYSGCFFVHREGFLALLSKKPHLAGDLLPRLGRNLVGCTNCFVESACHRVEARIARLLLHLLSDSDHGSSEEGWIPLRLSRQEIADLTGTTLETCSRVMSRFRKNRIVVTSDDGFLVRDRDSLLRVALR